MSTHVCFVSTNLYSYFYPNEYDSTGGAERQEYIISTELADREFDVSVITGSFDEGDYDTVEGVSIRKTILHDSYKVNKIRSLFQSLHAVDADVYYSSGSKLIAIITGLYCSLTNSRFIHGVVNDETLQHKFNKFDLFNQLYIKSIQSADTIIAQKPHQQNQARNNFRLETTVIPDIYPMPDEGEILSHSDRRYVLWVGTLRENQKRPMRYLELAKQLPSIDFKMIAAPGNDDSFNEKIISTARDIENLDYVGFVPPDEMDDYYRRSMVLVNTSEFEGFPNTFIEAWRFKTPVISLKFNLPGVFNSNGAGVHSGTMEQLQKDVKSLAEDLNRRSKLGENSRNYVLNNHSFDSNIDDYVEVFK